MMEQTSGSQAQDIPADALVTETGETALLVGHTERKLASESGDIEWAEPKAHLPTSRRALRVAAVVYGQ